MGQMSTACLREAVEEDPIAKRKTLNLNLHNNTNISHLIEITINRIDNSGKRARVKVVRMTIEQNHIILDHNQFELEKEERRKRMEDDRMRNEQQSQM